MAKVVLITGASAGIGMRAAELLLDKGCIVYAAARREEKMQPLKEKGAHIIKMDLTDESSISVGVARVISEQGRIDVLINNAGYGYFGPLELVPLDEARRQFEVNVFGLASLCQKVLPIMRERRKGRIVNVASMAGHFCEPRGDWYHATKYAVVALSECMRMELSDFGIKVAVVEPGAIKSEWTDIAMKNMEDCCAGTPYEKSARNQARLFRWGYAKFASTTDGVARAIVRAATSWCPRLTYRKGYGSSFIIFAKAIMPERMFEGMMKKMFN